MLREFSGIFLRRLQFFLNFLVDESNSSMFRLLLTEKSVTKRNKTVTKRQIFWRVISPKRLRSRVFPKSGFYFFEEHDRMRMVASRFSHRDWGPSLVSVTGNWYLDPIGGTKVKLRNRRDRIDRSFAL